MTHVAFVVNKKGILEQGILFQQDGFLTAWLETRNRVATPFI